MLDAVGQVACNCSQTGGLSYCSPRAQCSLRLSAALCFAGCSGARCSTLKGRRIALRHTWSYAAQQVSTAESKVHCRKAGSLDIPPWSIKLDKIAWSSMLNSLQQSARLYAVGYKSCIHITEPKIGPTAPSERNALRDSLERKI